MGSNFRRLTSLILVLSTSGFLLVLPANLRKASERVVLADSLSRDNSATSFVKGSGFKRQPVRFELNRGQTDAQAKFIAKTADKTLFLTSSDAVLSLPEITVQPEPIRAKTKARKLNFAELPPLQNAVLRLRPVKCNAQPRLVGVDKLPGVSNYFVGNDPKKWRTNVEAFAKVKYENLYPGIDLIYYGNEAGELEYDFIVAPGASPDVIAMSVEGASEVDVDRQSGDLLLATSVGQLRQHSPRLYQEVNGKHQEIAGHYRLLEPVPPSENQRKTIRDPVVAFAVNDYDPTKPLVIDPVVVYSTLLGGAAGNFDGARGVAVDAQGNAYITGTAESSDFPTRNPLDGTPPQRFGASSKAFVSKFAPDGSLVYSTFLGGNDSGSGGSAIAVDATGNLYVGGSAGSGFPIKNAFQPTLGSPADAFITKLNPEGTTIIYSSYLGGNQGESVRDLKLDAQNKVYILGDVPGRGVQNVTFPTVNPTQSNYGGGDSDMFLSVVAATGANLLFSTFFGGSGDEQAESIAISPDGKLIAIVGASNSTNLTTRGMTTQAEDPSCDELEGIIEFWSNASDDGVLIIAKIVERIRRLFRSTFGVDPTCAELLAIFYTTIKTTPSQAISGVIPSADLLSGDQLVGSAAYAATSGLVNPSTMASQAPGGGFDVVVASIDENGNGSAKGIFGGSRDEFVDAATKDSRGGVYVAGDTTSTDLPTVAPTQAAPGGANDNGFVVVFAPDTYEVMFATYLGGDGFTLPQSIAVDSQGNFFVSGVVTTGTTFPTTPGAFQRDLKGRNDAFLVKYSPVNIPTGPDFTLSFPAQNVTATTGKTKITANIDRTGGFAGNVTITPVDLPQGIVMPFGFTETTEDKAKFKLKIKGNAARGPHQLTFAAKDNSGRTRTASLTLVLQ